MTVWAASVSCSTASWLPAESSATGAASSAIRKGPELWLGFLRLVSVIRPSDGLGKDARYDGKHSRKTRCRLYGTIHSDSVGDGAEHGIATGKSPNPLPVPWNSIGDPVGCLRQTSAPAL